MADFSNVRLISGNLRSAEEILFLFQKIHKLCILVEGILERYNTDAAFKAEADHLFSPTQIAELGDMITDVQGLRTNWETDHPDALIPYIPITI